MNAFSYSDYRSRACAMRDIWYARKGCKTNPIDDRILNIRRCIILFLVGNRIIT